MRAARSSPTVTLGDAVNVWLMRWQGTCQHDIAAALHVNPGRVNEILKGHRFPEAQAIAQHTRRPAPGMHGVLCSALPDGEEQPAAAMGVPSNKNWPGYRDGKPEPQASRHILSGADGDV